MELSVRLIKVAVGDEIILPSFTYVSTANSAMSGARPVFVDIDKNTLNIAIDKIEERISSKTKAIICIQYGGYPSDLDELVTLCKVNDLVLLEDSAHSTGGKVKSKSLGTFGKLGALSFHETKNITCGQGGALLINDENLINDAHIISQKGTDRKHFLNGTVEKYTWKNIGSSWVMSEIHAALLWAQLENFEIIQNKRKEIWIHYHEGLFELEKSDYVKRPILDFERQDSFHNYFVILNKKFDRENVLSQLSRKGIQAVSHYEPLHSSDAGKRFSMEDIYLPVTDNISNSLIRLPFHHYLKPAEQDYVVDKLSEVLKSNGSFKLR